MQNPDPIDLHVGRRLRLAGTTLGYAQVELVDFVQSLEHFR